MVLHPREIKNSLRGQYKASKSWSWIKVFITMSISINTTDIFVNQNNDQSLQIEINTNWLTKGLSWVLKMVIVQKVRCLPFLSKCPLLSIFSLILKCDVLTTGILHSAPLNRKPLRMKNITISQCKYWKFAAQCTGVANPTLGSFLHDRHCCHSTHSPYQSIPTNQSEWAHELNILWQLCYNEKSTGIVRIRSKPGSDS